MSEEAKPNVFQRIHAVQREVGTVAKNGRNTFQSYDYATEADFVHAIKPLLDKHGLVLIPEVVGLGMDRDPETGQGKMTQLTMKYKIVNIDDPTDFTEAIVPGQGADKGDKGVYKAITGAKKYMLANTFMIPTGDDPEKDSGPKKKAKRATKSEDF